MNILVLALRGPSETDLASGSAVVLREVTKRWVQRGHRVRIVCGRESRALPKFEELNGVETKRVGFPGASARIMAPAYLASEYARTQRAWADMVVENLLEVPLLTPFYVQQPLLVLAHHLMRGDYFKVAPWYLATLGYVAELPLLFYKRAPFCVVGQRTRQDLLSLGIPCDRIQIAPCGVDHDRCRPSFGKSGNPTILWLGRWSDPRKRFCDAIQAVDIVREGIPEVQLLVAGQPGLSNSSAWLEGKPWVRLLGHVDQATKLRLYQESWVTLSSSLKEGFGLTALEAAACGTTTVCYGGCGLETVLDGITGLHARAGDVSALAAALTMVLADQGLRDTLSHQAQIASTQYSWDLMAQRILELLQGARQIA